MPNIPTLTEMLQAGLHFGHQTSKWHPKMKKFIFGERNGIHIINLESTQKALDEALAFIKKTALRGGVILFVGTKKQASGIVEEAAKSCGMPFVSKRWLGGTLTNFASMMQLIRKYKDMKRRQEKGEYAKYTKFEQMKFAEEIAQLDEKVGGIQDLNRIPDAILIFDIKKDKTALEEALKRGIKIIAMCDSNVDPTYVDYPIPGNDDAVKAIDLAAKTVAAAVREGREEWETARARLGGSLVSAAVAEKK
jgi:small subunit ribosomal protein S2